MEGVSGATLDLLSDFLDRALRFSALFSLALLRPLFAGEDRPELALEALGLFWLGDPRDFERALGVLEPAGEAADSCGGKREFRKTHANLTKDNLQVVK